MANWIEGFRDGGGDLNGWRAGRVIIQGEIWVLKDLPLRGPRGGISRPWISRAVYIVSETKLG